LTVPRTTEIVDLSVGPVATTRKTRWQSLALKAAIDRSGALLALVVLCPLLLCIAVAVKTSSRGPVLFRQERVGLHGRHFRLWKFRTMVDGAHGSVDEIDHLNEHDGPLFKVRDDPRVTRLGRRLRRLSLDELPQLWNVVRGQMSLVGPRPPLQTEVDAYGADERRRLVVKPGMTGLWQISGRAELPWSEAVRLDLYYVENWSIPLDLVVLWKTIGAVRRGHGAY
jgi:exopolysaccharide biosynthesis polyprenyl glycosylphosphotransferase